MARMGSVVGSSQRGEMSEQTIPLSSVGPVQSYGLASGDEAVVTLQDIERGHEDPMEEKEGGICSECCLRMITCLVEGFPKVTAKVHEINEQIDNSSAQLHLGVSLSSTFLFVLLYGLLYPVSQVLCGIVEGILVFVMALAVTAHYQFVRRNVQKWLTVGDLWFIYLSVVLEFSCFYIMCQIIQGSAYRYTDDGDGPTSNAAEKWVRFMLLSISTQTHIGLGDVVPWLPLPDIVSTAQMGLGMLFTISFLICINRLDVDGISAPFKLNPQRKSQLQHQYQYQYQDGSSGPIGRGVNVVEEFHPMPHGEAKPGTIHCPQLARGCRICLRRLARFIYLNLFLLVCLFEVVMMSIIYGANFHSGVDVVVLVLQLLLCTALCVASYILVLRTKVRLVFLAQSFGSTCLAFAGAYVSLVVYDNSTFDVPNQDNSGQRSADVDSFGNYVGLVVEFLHFSFSVMTTTGFSDITPKLTSSYLLVGCHMLVSVLFTVIIMGLGLRNFSHSEGASSLTNFLTAPRVLGDVSPTNRNRNPSASAQGAPDTASDPEQGEQAVQGSVSALN